MSDTSAIEWTDATWNPTVGCTKVSAGCDHCYAETLVNRFAGSNKGFPNRFDVMTIRGEEHLTLPLRWRKPKRIFVNSLSDLFHDDVPDEFIAEVWAVMALAEQHRFQLLTKRHARMRSLLNSDRFHELVEAAIERRDPAVACGPGILLENVWLGVSVENQQWADIRIPALLDTPAAVRFLSCEPLLGPVNLGTCGSPRTCSAGGKCQAVPLGIDWVIVGGESGRGARPMHTDWAESLRDQCVAAGVPFLFKQHGENIGYTESGDPNGVGRSPWADRDPDLWVGKRTGRTWTIDEEITGESALAVYKVGKKAAGRELDGRTWDEFPAVTSG